MAVGFLLEHILQISGVNTVIIRSRQRVSGTHHDTAEATLPIALINKQQTLVISLNDCNVIVSDVLFLSCCKLAVLAIVATSSNNENC